MKNLLLLLAILVVCAIYPLVYQSYFDQSLEDIPKMQSKKRIGGFLRAIGYTSHPFVAYFVMIAVFHFYEKRKMVELWCQMGFAIWF